MSSFIQKVTAGAITLGGDVTGAANANTVSSIQGVVISGTPSNGQVLTATSASAADWATPAAGFTAGGDLSGTSTSQTVVGLNGKPIVITSLVTNDVLVYNGTDYVNQLIANAQVSTTAAIAVSKLAAGTAGQVLMNNATPAPVYTSISGDITLGNTGAVSVVNITGSSGTATVTASTKLNFGTNPSTTGLINLPNNTFIYQRNAANSADIVVIGNSSSNGLIIGDATNSTGAMTIQCASNINIQPKNSCTIAQQVGGNQFAVAFDSMLLELPLLEFQFNQATGVITQVTQTSDVATNTITIKAQQAYASATTHITGGQLSLSSGVGVASGTATASEAAGILSLQAGTTQVMGLDGYGVFLEKPSGGAVSVTSNVTLSAAQVICPYIVLTGTVGAGGVTLSIPGAVAANTARMWHFDLTAVTLTGTLTFSIGTGSTTASISSLTTNSQIVTLFAPTSNTCFLNL